MMKRVRSPLIPLILLLAVSCTALGLQVKPYSEMSPKEKMTLFFKVYNAQYSDYKVMAASSTLTDVQRVTMRNKKAILIRVYTIIQALDMMVIEGKPLNPGLEAEAVSLLNMLGAAITK